MGKAAVLVVCTLAMFLVPKSVISAQTRDESFRPGFEGSVGAGYIHAMGGITSVWTEGGEVELSGAYDFLPYLGIESTGIVGFTGMADAMKTSVQVEDSYGNISTETPTGGLYLAILLGPRFTWSVPSSPGKSILLSLGGGAFRQGEKETGITAVDYSPRWTFGWGAYAAAGVHFRRNGSSDSWGIQLRYLYSPANVNDFNSPNPPEYTDDQRLMLVIDFRGKL